MIVTEGTKARYLTGRISISSRFSSSATRVVGDEFGPYLIRTDRNGKVQAVHETKLDARCCARPTTSR